MSALIQDHPAGLLFFCVFVLFLIFFLLFYYAHGCFACVFVCITHACLVSVEARRGLLDPLELELTDS